jgi:hypothetical protein
MSHNLKTDIFRAPSYLASALINGDYSGLEERRDQLGARWVQEWVRYFYGPRASIVDCEDAGLSHCMSPLIPAPKILDVGDLWLAGDSQFYTVLY